MTSPDSYRGAWADIFTVRSMLDVYAADLVVKRIDDAGIMRLRQLATQPDQGPLSAVDGVRSGTAFYVAIGELSANPAITLFSNALSQLTLDIAPPDMVNAPVYAESRAMAYAYRGRLVDAIVSGDRGQVQQVIRSYLPQMRIHGEALLGQGACSARSSSPNNVETHKRGRQIATRIAQDIARMGWSKGHRIGAELELCAKYGVSWPVFREAVRILERYAIVSVQRGTQGGLVAGTPDPSHTISSAVRYLQQMQLQPRHLFEIWEALMPGCAQQAAGRVGAQDIVRLRAECERLSRADANAYPRAAISYFELIFDLSGNRILSLFLKILFEALRVGGPLRKPDSTIRGRFRDLDNNVVGAIATKDDGMARRFMTERIQLAAKAYLQ